jgi:gliding motility-associated-like protein
MLKKKFILLFVCSLVYSSLRTQITTYNMSDSTVTDCEGILEDSEALFGGKYDKNEDFTFRICPGPGQIIFTFSMLSLEPLYDSIMFYDGPSTASPFITGYTGSFIGIPPPVVSTSGCLTIRFISDGTLQLNGWEAMWNTIADEPIPPRIIIPNAPDCDSTSFVIEFDTLVHCDSIRTANFNLTGNTAPTITNVTPIGCINDSTRFARVDLNAPFTYSCEYNIDFDINFVDACDSLYSFTVDTNFTVITCDIIASVSQGDDTICSGQCTNLNLSLTTGCNTNTILWNNGLPATVGPHNVCPLITTKYYITVTDDSTGMQYNDSLIVYVTDTLALDLTFSISNSNPTECDSTSFDIIFDSPFSCDLLDSGVFILNSSYAPPVVLSATAINCTGNMIDSVIIQLATPLISNCDYYLDYVLNVHDECNNVTDFTISDTFTLATCNLIGSLAYTDTICVGGSSNVTATINGCSTFTYTWSNGLPNSPGPHSISPTDDTTFYLVITEDSTGLIYRDTVNIVALQVGVDILMSLNLIAPNCAADSIILDFSDSVSCAALIPAQFTISGGPSVPTIMSISPVNCNAGNTMGAVIYLSNTFNYNCDYNISFNLDTIDDCGNIVNIVIADTFRVQDCEINYTLAYTDTICLGSCTNIGITSIGCFGLTYTWSNGLPSSTGPHNICPIADTTFSVIIIEDSTGAIAHDTVSISALPPGIILTMNINTSAPNCAADSIIIDFNPSVNCPLLIPSQFTLSGGPTPPTVTSVTPINCISGEASGAIIYLSNTFDYSCDYDISFDIDTVDLCGNTVSLTFADTFRVQDCQINYSVAYNDTVCIGNCSNITITPTGCFPLTYLWSNGLPNSAGPHNICPTNDTTFSVIITDDSTGVIAYDTVSISALPPGIILTMNINTSAPNCAADSIIIDFNPSVNCPLLIPSQFTLSGGPTPPTVTGVTPVNCISGEATGVIIYLSNAFDYSCDYDISFDIDTVDLCGNAVSLTLADTFRVQDCQVNYALTYTDTVCIGNCSNVTISPTACFGFTYVWSNGLPNSPGPHNICPTTDTIFSVIITDDTTGIIAYDTVHITALTPGIILTMNVNAVAPNCAADSIVLDFSPSVNCASLTASRFTLNGGGPLVPLITSITPISCIAGEATGVIIYLSNSFDYNCDYDISFNLDTVDLCGNVVNLIYADTFRVQDCQINDTLNYTDTVCSGSCTNVTYTTTGGCFGLNYVWSNGLPDSPGPHNICPTNDTSFSVIITEDSTGIISYDTINIVALPIGINLTMAINAVTPNCGADSIILDFSPSVNCTSLTMSRFTFNGGGPSVSTITSISSINCVSGEATGAIIYLSNSFEYNCDYDISFNLDTVDLCGTPYNLTYADTFRVQDCQINDTLNYIDTVCFGDCSSVNIANIGCFGVNYVWSNGLPNSPGPHNICPIDDTVFSVIITESLTGVTSYDTVRIEVDNRLQQFTMVLDSAKGLPSCDSVTIHLKFNKNILCDSIYLGAFTLGGSAFPPAIVNTYPTGCSGPNDSTNTATIVMANNFYGNCGYTINFTINSPTCNYTMGTSFNMLDCELVGISTYNDSLCNGTCSNVSYTTNSCFPITYSWSNTLPGTAGPHNICPNSDTTFFVTLTDFFSGKTLTDTINIRYLDASITAPSNFCASDPAINLMSGNAGGLWSGNGIINPATGLFDPAVAGAGIHKIKYNFITCSDSVMITVTAVEAGNNDTVCNDGNPFALTGFSPPAGTWTGPFISPTGVFTPITYGVHKVYYTFNGCTDSTEIFVDTIATSYSSDTVCNYTPAYNIPISPAGGTWSGIGITNTTLGTFDPSIVPLGNNTVYYNYLGCMDSIRIYVNQVTLGNDTTACPMQAPFNIPGAQPTGGTWSGIGITSITLGTYDPAIIGNNQVDTIIYTLYGCTDTMLINVIQTDVLIDTLSHCLNGDSLQLNNITNVPVTPSTGGSWIGNGVVLNGMNYFFKPNLAGIGVHTLYYNENTCIDSLVMVVYTDQLSYNNTTVCNTHTPFMLDFANNIIGSSWSGPGITNTTTGMFNPAIAPTGNNIINYINPATNCLDSITVNVYQFVLAQIQSPDTLCFFNYDTAITAIPAGGTWSGTGIYNQITGTINPTTAGQGGHQIVYNFGIGQCFTTDTFDIYVREPLDLTVSALPSQICPGFSSVITSIGADGNIYAGYTYTWNHTPSNSSVQSVSPSSSTTYRVTLTDGCSTPAVDSQFILVYPIPISTLSTTPTTCFNEIGYVTYDVNQFGYTYNWLNPTSPLDTNYSQSGDTISVRVTNNFGCFIDTAVIIPTYGPIIANFEVLPNLPVGVCLPVTNPTATLVDNSLGGLTGTWNLEEAEFAYSPSSNISYTYDNGGEYEVVLIIKNAGPCYDTANALVCVIAEPIFVPDIFSPNGDGANDILYARGSQIDKIEFTVFDRWGNQLFNSKNSNTGWDGTVNGKLVNAGVYVYYVKALLDSGDLLEFKGDVTLVR